MIKKLFGAVIGAAKAAGKAKKAFDDIQAKLDALDDDLADENKIAEKDEILAELHALKEDIPTKTKEVIACIKPLAFRVKHVSIKAWGLAVHVFNTTADSEKANFEEAK